MKSLIRNLRRKTTEMELKGLGLVKTPEFGDAEAAMKILYVTLIARCNPRIHDGIIAVLKQALQSELSCWSIDA